MKYKSLIIILVTTAWFFSCKEEGRIISNTNRSINQFDFKETRKLSGIILQNISDSLFMPGTVYIEGNYLFISERTSDEIMHLVKVPDDEYLGTRGTRGAGPGELLGSWKFFSPESGTIAVFDIELGKIALYNTDTLLHENRFDTEFINRNLVYTSTAVIQENKLYFLGNNNNNNRLGARFYSLDIDYMQDSLKKYGELPKLNKPYPNFSPEDEMEVLSYAHLINKGNLFVIAYFYIPLVEIYNLDQDQQVFISGPDELPSPDLFGNIRYYNPPCITNNYIYLLYVENKTEHAYTSKTVFILNHDGTPVKKLVLDREIYNLAVYEDRFLYGLIDGDDKSDFALVKFPIE